MTRTLRFLTATLFVGVILLFPAIAAGAQEEEGDDVEVAPIAVDSGAAIDVPPIDPVETADPWTTRFLLPTTLAITVVVIGGVIVYYLVAIKGRYTVASE